MPLASAGSSASSSPGTGLAAAPLPPPVPARGTGRAAGGWPAGWGWGAVGPRAAAASRALRASANCTERTGGQCGRRGGRHADTMLFTRGQLKHQRGLVMRNGEWTSMSPFLATFKQRSLGQFGGSLYSVVTTTGAAQHPPPPARQHSTPAQHHLIRAASLLGAPAPLSHSTARQRTLECLRWVASGKALPALLPVPKPESALGTTGAAGSVTAVPGWRSRTSPRMPSMWPATQHPDHATHGQQQRHTITGCYRWSE